MFCTPGRHKFDTESERDKATPLPIRNTRVRARASLTHHARRATPPLVAYTCSDYTQITVTTSKGPKQTCSLHWIRAGSKLITQSTFASDVCCY